MLSVSKKVLTSIIFCFLITSCNFNDIKSRFFQKSKPNSQEIRLVDINGNYRPTNRRVPKFNEELMRQQKNISAYERLSAEQKIKNEQLQSVQQEESSVQTSDLGPEFGRSNQPLLNDNKTPGKEQPIIYDIGKGEVVAAENTEPKKAEPPQAKAPAKIFKTSKDKSVKGIFVQIGSFSSSAGAQSISKKGEKFATSLIKEIKVKGKKIHKVLLGPVSNKEDAKILLRKVRKNGFKDAFITKIK